MNEESLKIIFSKNRVNTSIIFGNGLSVDIKYGAEYEEVLRMIDGIRSYNLEIGKQSIIIDGIYQNYRFKIDQDIIKISNNGICQYLSPDEIKRDNIKCDTENHITIEVSFEGMLETLRSLKRDIES